MPAALLLTHADVADCNVAAITVDAPTVFADTIDTLRVADIVVDVHHDDVIVSVDVNLVRVVSRTREHIAVDACNEALAVHLHFFALVVFLDDVALLLEVHLTLVAVVFGIDDHGIVEACTGAANQ